jgi:glycine cleavage system H protein
MNIPTDLLYSESHEWVRFLDNGNARIGITDHAQRLLSDLVFANICDVGEEIPVHGIIGDVESIKAVSDIYSPVSGTVVAVNQDVIDDPSLINSEPYESWLVEISNPGGKENLISPEAYSTICLEA